MKYEIWGEICPAVTIKLNKGEGIFTQQGGMSWMTENVQINTTSQKGFRKFLGDYDGFLAEYSATEDRQEITFSATRAGQILAFDVNDEHQIIGQRALFLCAEKGVEIKTFLANYSRNLPGGEGYHLQQFEGKGKIFLEMTGSVRKMELEPGEKMLVESGNLAAWDASVHHEVQLVRNFKSMLFGGEGALISSVTGPGRIWLQTAPVSELAKRVIPYVKGD